MANAAHSNGKVSLEILEKALCNLQEAVKDSTDRGGDLSTSLDRNDSGTNTVVSDNQAGREVRNDVHK